MRVRNATKDDLGTILTLNAFVQRQHAEALPQMFKFPTDAEQSVEALSATLNTPDNLVFLAEGAEAVGYLYAQFQNRPASWGRLEIQVLYIHHMVIAPKFRRRGVGTLLLLGAMDSARSKGINRVELDVWAFNGEAKKFYTKHGFEVFNERMQLSINGSQQFGRLFFHENTCCIHERFRVVIRPSKVLLVLFIGTTSQVQQFKTAV